MSENFGKRGDSRRKIGGMQYFARLAENFEAGAERDVETGRAAYNGGRSAF
jgi:hypothetical protein